MKLATLVKLFVCMLILVLIIMCVYQQSLLQKLYADYAKMQKEFIQLQEKETQLKINLTSNENPEALMKTAQELKMEQK